MSLLIHFTFNHPFITHKLFASLFFVLFTHHTHSNHIRIKFMMRFSYSGKQRWRRFTVFFFERHRSFNAKNVQSFDAISLKFRLWTWFQILAEKIAFKHQLEWRLECHSQTLKTSTKNRFQPIPANFNLSVVLILYSGRNAFSAWPLGIQHDREVSPF